MRSFERDLPQEVETVHGQIGFLTPSLTILLVRFDFATSLSEELNRALRARYRTFHRMEGWYRSRVMTPDFQRRDAVRDLERAQIERCRSWLATFFPGYFASGGGQAPATLLAMTHRVVPFELDEANWWWMPEAGIGFALERWETGIDGLRLALRPREDGVTVLAGRQSDVFADEEHWTGYGHEDKTWSLRYEIDSDLGRLFAFLTSERILQDGRRRLASLRDSLVAGSSTPSDRQLSMVQRQLATLSSDLTSLTAEMLAWPGHRAWVLDDVPDLTVVGREAATPLKYQLLDFYVEDAREVREFEAATRGLLIATAEIGTALQNIRLQNFVRWIAVLALLVSLVALAVAAVGVSHDLSATPRPVSSLIPTP
jgi:hypothetical protein